MFPPAIRPDQELCTVEQAAELIVGVSRSQWYKMDSEGSIGPSPVHIGTLRKYVIQEIRDWCRAGCPSRSKWRRHTQPDVATDADVANFAVRFVSEHKPASRDSIIQSAEASGMSHRKAAQLLRVATDEWLIIDRGAPGANKPRMWVRSIHGNLLAQVNGPARASMFRKMKEER